MDKASERIERMKKLRPSRFKNASYENYDSLAGIPISSLKCTDDNFTFYNFNNGWINYSKYYESVGYSPVLNAKYLTHWSLGPDYTFVNAYDVDVNVNVCNLTLAKTVVVYSKSHLFMVKAKVHDSDRDLSCVVDIPVNMFKGYQLTADHPKLNYDNNVKDLDWLIVNGKYYVTSASAQKLTNGPNLASVQVVPNIVSLTVNPALNWRSMPGISGVYNALYAGEFYIAAKNGAFINSADGLIWSNPTTAVGDWKSITHTDDANYFAIGENCFASSTDHGDSWTVETLTGIWNKIIGMPNGTLYAFGNNKISRKMKNGSWTDYDTSALGVQNFISAVRSGNILVTISGSSIYYLDTSKSLPWTECIGMPKPYAYKSITYGDGKFVAIGKLNGNGSFYTTSTDGIVWNTVYNLFSFQPAKSFTALNIAYGRGMFVITGHDGTTNNVIYLNTDMNTSIDNNNSFISLDPDSKPSAVMVALEYSPNDNRFVAIGNDALIYTD